MPLGCLASEKLLGIKQKSHRNIPNETSGSNKECDTSPGFEGCLSARHNRTAVPLKIEKGKKKEPADETLGFMNMGRNKPW